LRLLRSPLIFKSSALASLRGGVGVAAGALQPYRRRKRSDGIVELRTGFAVGPLDAAFDSDPVRIVERVASQQSDFHS
jgi:hypothetical protein